MQYSNELLHFFSAKTTVLKNIEEFPDGNNPNIIDKRLNGTEKQIDNIAPK